MQKRFRIILLLLILFAAGALRLWHISSAPHGLAPEEALGGSQALISLSNNDFSAWYPTTGFMPILYALPIYVFGTTSFALRFVSVILGVATAAAVYLFAREYAKDDRTALVAAFLSATSMWHIFFSRAAFRHVASAMLITAALWLIYYSWNRRLSQNRARVLAASAAGGVFFGLGFYVYGMFATSIIILAPIFIAFARFAYSHAGKCTLCIPAVFLFAFVVTIAPLALSVSGNPSYFASEFQIVPSIKDFAHNSSKTFLMFFTEGDRRWLNNWPAEPALWWPAATFFAIGILAAVKKKYAAIIVWLTVGVLTAALYKTIAPNAGIALIAAPAAYILAALGIRLIWSHNVNWLKRAEEKYSDIANLIARIRKEYVLLVLIVLGAIATQSYITYFNKWAINPYMQKRFGGDTYTIGRYMASAPDNIPKYVITDSESMREPIIFASGTATEGARKKTRTFYVTTDSLDKITCDNDCMIFPIDDMQPTLKILKKSIPSLKLERDEKFNILVARPTG